MKPRFDIEQLKRALGGLSSRHRTAFAATCCERLLPNYSAFVRSTRWGQPNVLRESLDFVWRALDGGAIDRAEVERLIQRCEAVIPDTEDFSSIYTSAALDAGTAIVETLRSLVNNDPQHVVDVATFSRDTVDMFIQQRDRLDFNTDSEFEEKIAADPLMIDELSRQAEVLEELRNQPLLDRFFLKHLRFEAQNRSVSNIGVPA